MATSARPRRTLLERSLSFIERAGNALPHPATLFALLAVVVVVASGITSLFGLSVTHPGTGKEIVPVNLLSVEGLHRIVRGLVTNFTNFAPLGTVLVAMLGIGIAESSGMIGAALRLLVLAAPKRLMTFVIVLAGILSNTASEVGYVLLVPLGGVIFHALGRHPLAGIAAAFAGVSGGYSANLLLGTIDPLLAGLTQEAAHIVDASYMVGATANYYFLAASTFVIAFGGTWVTERIVVPRLGVYQGEEEAEQLRALTPEEKRGLRAATINGSLFAAVVLAGLLPEGGFLRDLTRSDILASPLFDGVVAFIFLGAVVMGVAYGWAAGTITSDADVMKGMGKAIETLGTYVVLVFFAAQFVAFFNWTQLGLIVAVEGAVLLKSLGLGPIPLMILFVVLAAAINLIMGSASAKWAIMAPVFVPMFMLLGVSPELTQAAYRVGDSVTNIVSPMMSYFALIVAFVAKYDPKAGIGTVIATMLPYSVAFAILWMLLLGAWIALGIPVGPGTELFIPQHQS